MRYKVLIPRLVSGTGADFLRQRGCTVIEGEPKSFDSAHLKDCDAILAGGVGGLFYDARVLRQCQKCKILACFSVGVEQIDLQAAARQGIQVTNSGTANCNAVAEHLVYLLLACAKRGTLMQKAAAAGDFAVRQRVYNVELKDKCLGIIGCGNIGQAVARKCMYGLNMRVIAYDPFLKPEDMPQGVQSVTLPELLGQADFVTLHLNLTAETKGLIGEPQLAMMKPGAYILNVSRGGLIDEQALQYALSHSLIAGAGVDVYQQEPLPPGFWMSELDNVVMTPHCAAHTQEALQNMELFAAQDIWRVLNGEAPRFPKNQPWPKRPGSQI